jgi:hypothetical protein
MADMDKIEHLTGMVQHEVSEGLSPPGLSIRAINIINALHDVTTYRSQTKSIVLEENSLPTLDNLSQKIKAIITSLEQKATFRDNKDMLNAIVDAEAQFLYYSTNILESHLAQVLLDVSASIPSAALYWRDTELSDWKTAVHVVETIPERLWDLVSNFFGLSKNIHSTPFTGFSNELWTSLTDSFFKWRDPVGLGMGIASTVLRPPSVLELARRGIRKRRATLDKVKLLQAECLGSIAEDREFLQASSASIESIRRSLKRTYSMVERLEIFCSNGLEMTAETKDGQCENHKRWNKCAQHS